jgi:hypothetical protein
MKPDVDNDSWSLTQHRMSSKWGSESTKKKTNQITLNDIGIETWYRNEELSDCTVCTFLFLDLGFVWIACDVWIIVSYSWLHLKVMM